MAEGVIGTPLDLAIMIMYFVAVVGFGVYFGKYSSTTKDFYFGGQRFAWWLIAFSGIATTVGSYSFIKYSSAGYKYGLSSTQTYLNDWYWMPILLFLWLPVIYFNRIQSIPEYFEKRFGRPARIAAIVFILLYLITYVGINLLTLGTALHTLLGWPVVAGAAVAALTVTAYVMAGGQTSVIMTDLVQGVTLLVVGLGVFFIGVAHLGGFINFWTLLPESHRYLFSEFNRPDNFSFIGIYAQDGLANTGAFVLMNQGMIMRFLAIRSVNDARKMAMFWILILYPLAAITVSGGGWIAKALIEDGQMQFGDGQGPDDAFILAADFLLMPGIFGFVLAALMAALMSSADTLISAVSAVFVNDIYRPYIKPRATDKHYLRIARVTSLVVAGIGLVLVPVYNNFDTIYQAHAFITASIPPPVVTAILLGLLWKRFNLYGAMAALVGGGLLTALTIFPPFDELLLGPLAFGMGEGSYKFIRAIYGCIVSGVLGVVVAGLTRPQPFEKIRGLITGTQLDAMRYFKGSEINRRPGQTVYAVVQTNADLTLPEQDVNYTPDEMDHEEVRLSRAAMETLAAEEGDLLYVCDRRWWFGGLRSIHTKAGPPLDDGEGIVQVSPEARKRGHFTDGEEVYVEKVF
jgi:SSS family solute:Na+ symporter